MIKWKPIDELPDELKDGRDVLLWDSGHADVAKWLVGHWSALPGQDGAWVSTFDEENPLDAATDFAEIQPPTPPARSTP